MLSHPFSACARRQDLCRLCSMDSYATVEFLSAKLSYSRVQSDRVHFFCSFPLWSFGNSIISSLVIVLLARTNPIPHLSWVWLFTGSHGSTGSIPSWWQAPRDFLFRKPISNFLIVPWACPSCQTDWEAGGHRILRFVPLTINIACAFTYAVQSQQGGFLYISPRNLTTLLC